MEIAGIIMRVLGVTNILAKSPWPPSRVREWWLEYCGQRNGTSDLEGPT